MSDLSRSHVQFGLADSFGPDDHRLDPERTADGITRASVFIRGEIVERLGNDEIGRRIRAILQHHAGALAQEIEAALR